MNGQLKRPRDVILPGAAGGMVILSLIFVFSNLSDQATING